MHASPIAAPVGSATALMSRLLKGCQPGWPGQEGLPDQLFPVETAGSVCWSSTALLGADPHIQDGQGCVVAVAQAALPPAAAISRLVLEGYFT
jgi:hypothetical protein